MYKNKILAFLAGILVSFNAYSLDNEDFHVTQVEVTNSAGLVHIDVTGKVLSGQPVCNSQTYAVIACDINDAHCETMMAIALEAKTTGNVVDFDFDGQCKGSFATATRFRLSN